MLNRSNFNDQLRHIFIKLLYQFPNRRTTSIFSVAFSKSSLGMLMMLYSREVLLCCKIISTAIGFFGFSRLIRELSHFLKSRKIRNLERSRPKLSSKGVIRLHSRKILLSIWKLFKYHKTDSASSI
jgi:hypothetical protein